MYHDTFLSAEGFRFFGVSLSFPLIVVGAEESRTFLSLVEPSPTVGAVEGGGGGGRATVPAVTFLTCRLFLSTFEC